MTFIGFLMCATVGAAVAADIPGSTDHPLIPRYEGSEIVLYEVEPFAEYALSVGKPAPVAETTLALEGKVTRLTYRAPAQRSVLEVFRNYEKALVDAGFAPLFACTRQACGDIKKRIESGLRYMALSGQGDHQYLAARQRRPAGDLYVSLWVTKNHSGGGPSRHRAMAQLDVIELKPMEERMVFIDAGAMQRDLAGDGRVAVYGLLFDFDRDTLRPDSRPQLDEIGRLLAGNPALKVLIVGHTDNQGSYDYNLDLSRRRAASVVAALVRDHGVAVDRLTPAGVGMAAPVATNRTAAGQARNRRVELVER